MRPTSGQPYLFQDHTQIYPWIGKPGYNLITDMADEAIKYMKELNAAAPEKPFFLYYVPGGTHAPHHPTPEWIAKMKGKFDMGWNEMREQIFANQKKLGVIPQNTQLTPWPDSLPKWDTLNPDQKKVTPTRRKYSAPMSPTRTMRSAGSFRQWKIWANSITR